MTAKLLKGALVVGILSCAGTAAAQTASLIMEGTYERPASNIPFCGPCMTLWFVGASPGGQVDFTLQQPFPSSASPVVESVKADELGVAVHPFKPTAQGEARVQAASGPLSSAPRTCTPPIARGPRECPPPPRGPLRVQPGQAVAVPLDDTTAPATRAALHLLRTGPDPRWEAVPGRAVLRARPVREVRITGRGLRAGLYRLQLLDKDRRVIAVSLIEVKQKP
jgi:hypothetical protein